MQGSAKQGPHAGVEEGDRISIVMDQHTAPAGQLHDTRILIVEDEPMLALALQFALEDEGPMLWDPHAISIALSRSLKRNRITAAVLDIKLRDEFGSGRLRECARTSQHSVPVLQRPAPQRSHPH